MTVSIANKLVELRKKNGLSQEELAEKLGLSRQAVSKWERAEASPDTDNLITLARLYGISLDELLLDAEAAEPEPPEPAAKERVHISPAGIHVVDGDEEVHIDWTGVHVTEKDSDTVDIDKSGVYVNGVRRDDREDDVRCNLRSGFPITLVVLIAYVCVGAIFNVWHPTWIAFLAIPVVTSLITAIKRHNPNKFAYPLLATVVFLLLGFLRGLWHPAWVIYLTIPVYYSLFKGTRHSDYNEE